MCDCECGYVCVTFWSVPLWGHVEPGPQPTLSGVVLTTSPQRTLVPCVCVVYVLCMWVYGVYVVCMCMWCVCGVLGLPLGLPLGFPVRPSLARVLWLFLKVFGPPGVALRDGPHGQGKA